MNRLSWNEANERSEASDWEQDILQRWDKLKAEKREQEKQRRKLYGVKNPKPIIFRESKDGW